MTDTLRELDAEIATARGWERCVYGWRPCGGASRNEEHAAGYMEPAPLDDPPSYSSSWALAGPLLEEMARAPGTLPDMSAHAEGTRWRCNFIAMPPRARLSGAGRLVESVGATPCEAIARAWLAWHRAKNGGA